MTYLAHPAMSDGSGSGRSDRPDYWRFAPPADPALAVDPALAAARPGPDQPRAGGAYDAAEERVGVGDLGNQPKFMKIQHPVAPSWAGCCRAAVVSGTVAHPAMSDGASLEEFARAALWRFPPPGTPPGMGRAVTSARSPARSLPASQAQRHPRGSRKSSSSGFCT